MSDGESDIEVQGLELSDDDPLASHLPMSFGRTAKGPDVAAQIERCRRVVKAPAPEDSEKSKPRVIATSDSESDDDSDSDESSDDEHEFPVSHEMVLKTHERAVTTTSLDPAGGRLISGSIDCNIKFHDFSAMTPTTLRAFRTVDAYESKRAAANSDSHPVHHLEFNPLAGSVFLCVSAHPQPKILSRDGDILTEFVKGDMYLRDMHNTKGHISEVTTGTWHPSDKNICLTAGTDSTLRIWDINNKRKQKDIIVFKSKAAGAGGRTRMTAAAWSSQAQGGNNIIAAAALDGTLVMYSGDGPFTRPAGEIREAHAPNTWTGGLDISADGRMIVTRGGDDTIKLWDTRKFKEPLVIVSHPSTSGQYAMSGIKYSPNSANIITGSHSGDLHILNPANLRPELVTPVTPGSPLISVNWHPRINQIVTGSANAETHVLFNPKLSSRGAVEVMSRAPKKRHVDDNPELTMDQTAGISADSILTPGGILPGSKKSGVTNTGRSKDPRRPQVPQQTPFMKNAPDEKHITENIPLARMLHEDPREALLKYADVAEKDPMFTKAWQGNQPETQYREISDDEEEGPDRKKVKK
ncbi:hypothetical protein VUR80DRAFT_6291 [Thermomyces stellatus]